MPDSITPLPTVLHNFERHPLPHPSSPNEFEDQKRSLGSFTEYKPVFSPPLSPRAVDTESGGLRTTSALRNDVLAGVGEFIGTFLFLYFALSAAQSAIQREGVDTNSSATTDNITILYISFAFGLSLLVNAWVFFRITGAAFNPAVSFSLWLVGDLSLRRFSFVVPAQLLGAIAASGLANALTGTPGAETTTSAGVSNGMAIGIEAFATALLCFTVLFTAAEKSKSTFLAPVAIGLALFIGNLSTIGFTGAGINPARSFGPSVANHHFTSNAWVYYVGQFTGALLATVVYIAFKQLEYTTIVAGIDTDDAKASQDVSKGPLVKLLHFKWKNSSSNHE